MLRRTEDSTAMDYAAQNGHLHVVQWLHLNRTEGCHTWAMNLAAMNGHLHIVQWLHLNRTEGCTTEAMGWAAINGYFEIFKYLHHIGKLCTRDSIRYARQNGFTELANWIVQNVHQFERILPKHIDIQESVRSSIKNLMSNTNETFTEESKFDVKNISKQFITESILSDSVLTDKTKSLIMEFCSGPDSDEPHSTLNITFQELLVFVWIAILNNEHKDNIKAVMNTEMAEAECKCFTGRISRLINCLNGFDSRVSINLSDNEYIGNIVSMIGNKLEPYDANEHKRLVVEALTERGYGSDVINEWIGYIV